MKKILVPTDFSDNSKNALLYAIQIANQFDSTIMMMNAYEVHSTTGSFIAVEKYIKEDAETALKGMIAEVESTLNNGANIKYELINGNAISVIPRVGSNYDLIIMGTQGASGLIETFLGSTTSGVINRAKTPVLVIPNEARYEGLNSIVFALDSLAVKPPKVMYVLLELIKKNKSHVNFYHLQENGADTNIDPEIEVYFEEVKTSYYYEINKKSLNRNINKFIAKKGANMLCMLRRKRSALENLFHRSATKKEVFDSPVPVLILEEI